MGNNITSIFNDKSLPSESLVGARVQCLYQASPQHPPSMRYYPAVVTAVKTGFTYDIEFEGCGGSVNQNVPGDFIWEFFDGFFEHDGRVLQVNKLYDTPANETQSNPAQSTDPLLQQQHQIIAERRKCSYKVGQRVEVQYYASVKTVFPDGSYEIEIDEPCKPNPKPQNGNQRGSDHSKVTRHCRVWNEHIVPPQKQQLKKPQQQSAQVSAHDSKSEIASSSREIMATTPTTATLSVACTPSPDVENTTGVPGAYATIGFVPSSGFGTAITGVPEHHSEDCPLQNNYYATTGTGGISSSDGVSEIGQTSSSAEYKYKIMDLTPTVKTSANSLSIQVLAASSGSEKASQQDTMILKNEQYAKLDADSSTRQSSMRKILFNEEQGESYDNCNVITSASVSNSATGVIHGAGADESSSGQKEVVTVDHDGKSAKELENNALGLNSNIEGDSSSRSSRSDSSTSHKSSLKTLANLPFTLSFLGEVAAAASQSNGSGRRTMVQTIRLMASPSSSRKVHPLTPKPKLKPATASPSTKRRKKW